MDQQKTRLDHKQMLNIAILETSRESASQLDVQLFQVLKADKPLIGADWKQIDKY